MEALAVFGIACNVMQTISFAHEAVAGGLAIHRGECVDPNLRYTVDHLGSCMDALTRSIDDAQQPTTQESDDLVSIAKEILATGAIINSELAKISSQSQERGPGATIRAWIVFVRRTKSKLKQLGGTMRSQQHVLETQLLVRVCKNTDAALIQTQDSFKDLDTVLQTFVLACAQGQTRLEHLITDQSSSIKTHITNETKNLYQRTRDDIIAESGRASQTISTTLSAIQTSKAGKEDREKFLESLKYIGMDARRDEIKDPHDKTFEWVFNSIEDDVSESDCSMQSSSVNSTGSDETSGENDHDDPWDDFVEWLAANEPAPYWVSGKAGSGKSTFMRFLVEHSKTKEILTATREAPVLLSHFIWAAGGPLQRSVKGILSNLLYEFLVEDDALCSRVLTALPYAKRQTQIHEWSDRRLEKIAKEAFAASEKDICIFLDGVDEADDQTRVVDLLKRLNEVPRLRICLSSRPEPILAQSFRQYPKLCMHKLTYSDIHKYIFDQLRCLSWENEAELHEFGNEIFYKAAGVFLWVYLVVKQFRDGAAYYDSLAERLQYLEKLPGDLHFLYQQMWERQNNSQPGYRKDAARYLNLALQYYENAGYFHCEMHTWHIVLALSPSLTTAVINNCSESTVAELGDSCDITAKRIKARTAGLLEVSSCGQITLIHRSAHEFLRTSELGRKILQLDATTEKESAMNLIKGYLSHIHLTYLQDKPHACDGVAAGNDPRCLEDTLGRFQRNDVEGNVGMDGVLDILTTAKIMYQRNRWAYEGTSHYNSDWVVRPDFLVAAAHAGFLHYTATEIQRLKDDCPEGMKLSAGYRNLVISSASSSLAEMSGTVRHGAILIQALVDDFSLSKMFDYRVPTVWEFWPQPFLKKTNALLDALETWCRCRIDDEISCGRFILQLYQAGFNSTDPIVVSAAPDEYADDLVHAGNTDACVFNGVPLREIRDGMILETTTDSLLRMLFGYATGSKFENFGVASEIASVVNSSTAPFVLRLLTFIPESGERNQPSVCIAPLENEYLQEGIHLSGYLHSIQQATRHNALLRAQVGSSDYLPMVIIPGLSNYIRKMIKNGKRMKSDDFFESLVSDGSLVKTEEVLRNWPPEPYCPMTEEDISDDC